MKYLKILSYLIIFFLLINPITLSTSSNLLKNDRNKTQSFTTDHPENITIRIAQYPSLGSESYPTMGSIFDFRKQETAPRNRSGLPQFRYSWKVSNKTYSFKQDYLSLEEMQGKGEKPLNVDNYDLLYVGVNYWSYFRDGILFKKINENIKNFLSDGGGYIGTCAGASFASIGFEKPKSLYHMISNLGVLNIANVYMNQDWMGEMQYCIRANAALPSMKLKVESSNEVPIYKGYNKSHVNMTYGGGPGLYIGDNNDPKLGEIVPLLTIDEELMETKPIHWYRKGILPGWVPFKKVKTDLKGCLGGIATTYDSSGRIVLFSTHPEITLVLNNSIEETFGERSDYGSFGKIPRIVYNLYGDVKNMSYNYWMHRRSAAWAAGVTESELPPINELGVYMTKPMKDYYVYFNDSLEPIKPPNEILQQLVFKLGMSVIVGDITVEAYAENSGFVEFYLDKKLVHTDFSMPYNWTLDKNNFNGVHNLEVRAYDEYGNMAHYGSNFYFLNS